MNYLSDTGFVIRRINFGEADRYITVFTKEHGKIELIAKGVRKITSRRASCIELLNLIQFQAVKTSKNYILTEVQLVDSFEVLKHSLSNISMLFLISELIEKLCPFGQQHQDVFDLMYRLLCESNQDMKLMQDISLEYSDEALVTVRAFQEDRHKYNELLLFNFQVELLSRLGFWDQSKKFRDERDLREFIESILERKIKTRIYS